MSDEQENAESEGSIGQSASTAGLGAWLPIETAPRNGKQFICWNGDEMMILNQPKGCALGRWTKRGREWRGSFVRFDNPKYWMPIPKVPNDLGNRRDAGPIGGVSELTDEFDHTTNGDG